MLTVDKIDRAGTDEDEDEEEDNFKGEFFTVFSALPVFSSIKPVVADWRVSGDAVKRGSLNAFSDEARFLRGENSSGSLGRVRGSCVIF